MGLAKVCDVFATSQIRRRPLHRDVASQKKKHKSAFKPFISAYNHGMCTLNVYGSTGNKQTNTRTLAFYKGIDIVLRLMLNPEVNW